MSGIKSSSVLSRSVKRLLLLSSLTLSMSLTACARPETRVQFLMPRFQASELVCRDAPRGQLPQTATNEQVAERIVGIDEAGEDCRQRLARARLKIEVYQEVAGEIGAQQPDRRRD